MPSAKPPNYKNNNGAYEHSLKRNTKWYSPVSRFLENLTYFFIFFEIMEIVGVDLTLQMIEDDEIQ